MAAGASHRKHVVLTRFRDRRRNSEGRQRVTDPKYRAHPLGTSQRGRTLSDETDLEAAMTRFTRPLSAIAPAFAAAALLAATVPASTPASARSNFDGTWSVLIVTQKGSCDRAYRYPVKIDN